MRGIRLGRDDLIRSYGISQRLAVRIGALLSKGLEVTAVLLEIGGPGSAVEKLLLHPRLLEHSEKLDTALIQNLAAETGADIEGDFVIVESADSRTLGLSEELLAEEAAAATPSETLPATLDARAVALPGQLMDREEMARIFTAEEITRIKLDALTGKDVETRISALRKLLYAPLDGHEKGAIYLRTLLDPQSAVRSEAIECLESLGFNGDAADAIQAALDANTKKREAALRRISGLMGTLGSAETQIAAAVLIQLFREASPLNPKDPLLKLMTETVEILAQHADMPSEITRVCVQHLLVDPFRLGPPLRAFIVKLAASAPEPVVNRLWAETATVRDPGPRSVILGLLMELDEDTSRREALCNLVVDELLREDYDELSRQKLGHNLAGLGKPGVTALLDRFAQADSAGRARLVSFLDIVCVDHDLPAADCNRAARHLVDALKAGDRRLRTEILRTRVFHRRDVDPALRTALINELLPMLDTPDQPDLVDRASALLESFGLASAPGLFDLVREQPSSPVADSAIRILGHVLSPGKLETPQEKKLWATVYRFLCERIVKPKNRIGGYAAALGKLASSPAATAADAQKALDLLLGQIKKPVALADVITAIGMIAATPSATAEQRVHAVHLLGSMVERPVDDEEAQLRELDTDKGKTYEMAGEVEFDSEILPAAVAGLRRIALAPATSPALSEQIVEQLLRVWEGVAQWTTVWGPRSSETLSGSLGMIGAAPGVGNETRTTIVQALSLGLERLSVVRTLAGPFATPATSPKTNDLYVDVALRILDYWIQSEIAPEELRLVLTACSAVAARSDLGPRKRAVSRLRKRTSIHLYNALRGGEAWARPLLQQMHDCSTLPKQLKKDIAKHLASA